MKTNLNYCIVLSAEQLTYLAGSKYGIDRMKILHQLIEATVLKETEYAIKGFSTTLQIGQAVLSEVDLSSKLGYDKKTISRVLDKMNQLGIVASTQSNRTSIHTLKCISAWMQDGNRIRPILSLLFQFPHRLRLRKILTEMFRITIRHRRTQKVVCPKLLYAVLQEVPMSHKFVSLIRTT